MIFCCDFITTTHNPNPIQFKVIGFHFLTNFILKNTVDLALTPFCVLLAEDTLSGYRLSFSFYGLQAAAPAQCNVHSGVSF